MLRKFAIALVAASVFTAPVFAQGGGAAATPTVKTETKSGTAGPAASTAATPKVVTASPTLKSAKVKTTKRYAHRHVKHVKHVAHVKRVKHAKVAHAAHGTKGTRQARQVVSKSAAGQTGAMTAPKAKSNVN